ncbi:MAG: diguanylate cyclase [Armatimonadetes bacterium]|nr:diguanylate cyclase [Armatimonadota bacterium]
METEKLAPLFEQTPLPIYIYQDDSFKYVNRCLAKMVGYSQEELLNMCVWDLVHPGDREIMQERARRRLQGGEEVTECEFRAFTRGGELRILHGYFSLTQFAGRPAVLGQLLDVTEQKKIMQALRAAEARYRDLFENINDVVYIHDPAGQLLELNPAITRIAGYLPAELIGKNIREVLAPGVKHLLRQYLDEVLGRGYSRGPMRIWTKQNEERFLEYNSVLFRGDRPFVRGIARDITGQVQARRELREYVSRLEHINRELARLNAELNEARKNLERQARLDLLTGVGNRLAFQEKILEEMNRAIRYETPLTLLIIDITNFKLINDTLGHLAGDEALTRTARQLQANCRNFDAVFRIGGDEFAVILPQTGEEEAFKVAERFRRRISGEAITGAGVKLPVRLSVGFAVLTPGSPPQTIDRLIKEADDRMYEEKRRQKLALV